MKKIFLSFLIVSVSGIGIFNSCKKELSCKDCREGKPPTSIAGPDQVITLPTDSISLDGSASSDPDGTITEWLWTKISGPASFNIVNIASAKTVVKDLETGVYSIELKVIDNGGLSSKDTVQIIVDDHNINQPPVANAGADQTITFPTNNITIDASGSTDPDNNITSYAWAKISGPLSFNIANANAAQTQVANLVQGVYQVELKVTDAGGLFSKDTVNITVNPGSTNTHWKRLSDAPGYGIGSFIFGINADNVFVGESFGIVFWKYNNPTNSWNNMSNIPGQGGRTRVSFCVDGKGYLCMGFSTVNSLNEMYQYDPVVDQWIQKNNSPISGTANPLVINNSVYLVQEPAVWMYAPGSDSYTQKNNFPGNSPVNASKTSFVINDIGYFITGTQCWKYSTSTDTWQQKASLPGYLRVEAGFSLNNYGYILGDSSMSSISLNYPLQLWQYNPLNDQWLRIYDDYPGYGTKLIRTASLNGVAYIGFGNNPLNITGEDIAGDFWKFQ